MHPWVPKPWCNHRAPWPWCFLQLKRWDQLLPELLLCPHHLQLLPPAMGDFQRICPSRTPALFCLIKCTTLGPGCGPGFPVGPCRTVPTGRQQGTTELLSSTRTAPPLLLGTSNLHIIETCEAMITLSISLASSPLSSNRNSQDV